MSQRILLEGAPGTPRVNLRGNAAGEALVGGTALGDPTLPAAETDTGSFGLVQLLKRLLVKVSTYVTQGGRNAPLARIVDTSVANTTFICEASPGTATSVANWRVNRTVVAGSVTTTTWAGGLGDFNQVADNRTSLTYS